MADNANVLIRGVSVHSYMCININTIGEHFWRRLFNDTVYMEFRLCLSIVRTKTKYFHYVRQPMSFFMHFTIPTSISSVKTVKFIKALLKSFLVC